MHKYIMPGRWCLKLVVCGYFYLYCKKKVVQIMLKTHSTSHYWGGGQGEWSEKVCGIERRDGCLKTAIYPVGKT